MLALDPGPFLSCNDSISQIIQNLLEAIGVRALSLAQRLEPVGDFIETFVASSLGHARIHIGIFMRLARYRRLQVGAG